MRLWDRLPGPALQDRARLRQRQAAERLRVRRQRLPTQEPRRTAERLRVRRQRVPRAELQRVRRQRVSRAELLRTAERLRVRRQQPPKATVSRLQAETAWTWRIQAWVRRWPSMTSPT